MEIKFEGNDVFFPVTTTERITLSDVMRQYIAEISHQSAGNKIAAIKMLRAEFSIGLKSAKDIVEAVMERHPVQPKSLGQLLKDKLDRVAA